MKSLLYFIADYCMELLYEYGFKFTDSVAAETRSDGRIILSNSDVIFVFCQDRSIDTLDIGNKTIKKRYSFDIIYEYLTNTVPEDGNLCQSIGIFIKKNLGNIIDIFKNTKDLEETIHKLDILVERRTKRMWG